MNLKSYELKNQMNKFLNPLEDSKKKNYSKLLNILEKTIATENIPYYCVKCRKYHYKGKNHDSHYKLGAFTPKFNKIPKLSSDQIYHLQIVGIYYTNNGNYLDSLEKGTKLKLKPEPNNQYDSNAVSVWHNKKKLGYIAKSQNRKIFQALSQQDVKCILGRYYRSRNYYRYEFTPERANITVHVFDRERFHKIITGLLRIANLTKINKKFQKDIVDALNNLSFHVIEYLEKQEQTILIKNLLSGLYMHYSIKNPNMFGPILL